MREAIGSRGWAAILALGAVFVLLFAGLDGREARGAEIEVLVTNTGDSVEEGESECPSDTLCTLRRAIEYVNGQPGDDDYIIRFDPEVFPSKTPATIAVLNSPLPILERDGVVIDASDAGVIVDGSALPAELDADGIALDTHDALVIGLNVRGFTGVCIFVVGDGNRVGGGLPNEGNQTDSCENGIRVRGDGNTIQGNVVGFAPVPDGPAMQTAITVYDGDNLVGDDGSDPFLAMQNYVGGAAAGISVFGSEGTPTSATIRGNRVGIGPLGELSPVETGIRISSDASGVMVRENELHGVTRGVVVINPPPERPASTGNTIRDNEFDDLVEIGIDLGNDGPTPNDSDDSDSGPNMLQNYPEFERVTQSEITGEVPGPCPNCTVQLYLAERRTGELPDVPTVPIAGGTTTTNAQGEFSFQSPPVAPGQWIMATATNAAGNTSEFSAAARVGAGVVQCGGVQLQPGWNAAGYFDDSLTLGNTFPPGSEAPGPVLSIHELRGGSLGYESWFAEADGLNGLTGLSTGEAYWFYATEALVLPGSFTLTVALPVELEQGWNHFVYIGAEEDAGAALASLDGKFSALFRYDNADGAEGWTSYGSPETPEWARGFTTMEPCQSYFIHMTEAVTLEPLQP